MPIDPRPPACGEGMEGADCGDDMEIPLCPKTAGNAMVIAAATAIDIATAICFRGSQCGHRIN
jgi:hypothetical protein